MTASAPPRRRAPQSGERRGRGPLTPGPRALAPDCAGLPAADNSNKRVSAAAPAAGRPGLPPAVGMADADWPEPLAGRPDGAPWTRVSAAAMAAEPLELPWSERGVIVCGDGDYDAAALVDLAEQAGWPVLAEPSSGARRGPNALTGYQYLLASPEFMAAHRPEVIISAGRPGLTRPQSALMGLARPVAGGGLAASRRSGMSWSRRGRGCGPTRSGPRPTSLPRSGSPGRPARSPPAGSAGGCARTRRRRGARARCSTPGTAGPAPGQDATPAQAPEVDAGPTARDAAAWAFLRQRRHTLPRAAGLAGGGLPAASLEGCPVGAGGRQGTARRAAGERGAVVR